MVLNFTVDFEQEDNADFSLGSNDQPLIGSVKLILSQAIP